MANVKISDLTEDTTPATGDWLESEDISANASKKVQLGNITPRKADKSLLTVDSNPYKFLAYRNAAANTGNAAYAVVACDTEVFDSNSNHSAGVYTAPVDGYYSFYGQINVSVGGSNASMIVALYKNGSIALQGGALKVLASTSAGLTVSGMLSLAAGDTVDMRAYGEATSALGVGAASQNYFGGHLVSRT